MFENIFIALDAGIPNAAMIPSACSFTSGSMRTYKYADFLAIVGIPFEFFKVYHIHLYGQKQCKINILQIVHTPKST